MKNAKNVMNTIPLTFDEHQIKRSVIGGNSLKDSNTLNISVIVLNSQGSFYKMQMFENLCSCNFASIISVEPNAQSTYIDEVNKKFPKVKTIVPLEET